jgi:hypothetical protein
MSNVTYYLTSVYFLTTGFKVLNTNRTGQCGDSLRRPVRKNRGSLIA